MFCSESCATESMKFHKVECSFLQCDSKRVEKFLISQCSTIIRFLIESMELTTDEIEKLMLSDRVSVFDFDFSKIDDKKAEWNRLRVINSLLPSVNPTSKDLFGVLIETMMNHLNPSKDKKTAITKLTLSLMLILDRNCRGYRDIDKIVSRAKACFMFGSLMSHYCVPNTALTSSGAKQVHFVIKPIKKNEQIFVSYRWVVLRKVSSFICKNSLSRVFTPNRNERQQALLKDYGFICSCQGCINDYPERQKMLQKDPGFDYLNFISTLDVKDWKLKTLKFSNYITKKFKFYPSREIGFCINELSCIIQNACLSLEWAVQ